MAEKSDEENIRPRGLGARHLQAFFLFLAMMFAFAMRVNVSIAVVAMTDPARDPHFEWSLKIQSTILSSFFWGYILLQIPGGLLSRILGGKTLVLVSIAVNSAVCLVLPTAAQMGGWVTVCGCRVLQGMTQSFVYPCMHHLISQWIPLEDKGLLSTIIYAGGPLGIAAQLIAGGFIAESWGWPAIFYTNGALGAAWTAAYLVYGSACPERSKFISPEELRYIQKSLGREGEPERHPTPWRCIFSSLPFWALVVAHCGQNWGFFTLMTETPTYMTRVLGVNLKNSGILSSLPYLAMYALSFPMGALTDLIITKKWLSVTNCRKLFNSIGLWGPALALVGLALIPRDSLSPTGVKAYAVTMLTLAVGVNAGQYTGYMLIHTDLAPNYSGPLMGITNFIANIVSIAAPLVCGAIVERPDEQADWTKVFFLAAAVYFFTNLFFVLFVTSERQSWNEPQGDDIATGRKEEPKTVAESA